MNIALILAGGKGLRMGTDTPKQFLPLLNHPILFHTICAFEVHPKINHILVVSGENDLSRTEAIIQKGRFSKVSGVIAGGITRQESSFLGLSRLETEFSSEDIVLIHDAARPLINQEIIAEAIAAAEKYSAAAAAIPVQDTIIVSEDQKRILNIPDRKTLYAVQTPQAFRLGLILRGHREFAGNQPVTDDTGLLLSLGIPVYLVAGCKKNLKITSADDLRIAEAFLRE